MGSNGRPLQVQAFREHQRGYCWHRTILNNAYIFSLGTKFFLCELKNIRSFVKQSLTNKAIGHEALLTNIDQKSEQQ